MPQATYAELMGEGKPYIELCIDLKDPASLGDLVRAFAAVGSQFDGYLRQERPDLEGSAQLFVKQIRAGSIIVELIPVMVTLVHTMDATLIVDGFIRRFRGLFAVYIKGERPEESVTKTDVRDILDIARLVAKDTDGRASISSVDYHKTKTTERLSLRWDTTQAKKAVEVLERQSVEISLPAYEPFENVMMVMWQSNRKRPGTSKETGEWAIIEVISKKARPIIYESDMARDRIKYETTVDEKNAYRKGFYVDCNVERYQGKVVAYRITNVRNVIDLPDDDEPSLPSV